MKHTRFFVVALALLGLASCESVVDGLNVDPNNFTEISTNLLISQGVLNLASIAESEPARIAGMWTDQFSGSDRQYITQDNYGVADADFDNIWIDLYQRGYTQADIAEAQAVAENSPPREGVAQILKGYYAAEAALMFGDVPFTEVNDEKILDPVYDPQQDVLSGAIALLDAGKAKAGSFPVTASNISSNLGQILNSSATWGQFADALKARYLLAQRDYPGALAAAQDAAFDDPSASVDIAHSAVNFSENLFFQFEAEQRTDYLTFDGSYLIRMLSDTTDVSRTDAKTDDSARRAFFMRVNGSGFDGLNVSRDGFFAADRNFPVIGYPEVQLIIAECALRTGDTPAAIAALNNARNYWDGLTGTDNYQDYEASDFADDDALLEAILKEKFASVFGLPTMYDIIRTNNLIGTDLDGRNAPVQRFLYPAVEASSNSNFPGAKSLDDPTPINM
ncbi:MAG: RagB/SusD family nutrient uptake outer membrane protein [Bacteroidetes bacterium]|nr:MAG: RagB/SusD family nutrient uptake outer membrane protein [Bacteroidota bacterium]